MYLKVFLPLLNVCCFDTIGLSVPQLSVSLSNSRLVVARRMLDRANALLDRLEDRSCPLNPPSSDNNQPLPEEQAQDRQANSG